MRFCGMTDAGCLRMGVKQIVDFASVEFCKSDDGLKSGQPLPLFPTANRCMRDTERSGYGLLRIPGGFTSCLESSRLPDGNG